MAKPDPVVVLVGFGASSEEARKVYAHVERSVQAFVPACCLRWAFTSGRIVAKLRGEGVVLPTLAEALEELVRDDVERAVIQPLLTVPGQEYVRLLQLVGNYPRWRVGAPLLHSSQSVGEVVEALSRSLRSDCVNVVVCHGNRRHAEYNLLLLELASVLESRYANVVVASVEGSPGLTPLERAREMARKTGSVHFVPFMLVAGEHIQHDVMGDHPESWKNRVGAARVTCAGPLGATPAAMNLYLRRLKTALEESKAQCR
jgi:sirohydrochlorin cobaltochelatase